MPEPTRYLGRLSGKVAIVTGAGAEGDDIGIGRAIAIVLAREGAKVLCADIDGNRAESTADRIRSEGGDAIARAGNVSREADCAALVSAVVDQFGRLDILVNCAGYVNLQPATEIAFSEWQQHLAVNLTGPFLCSQAFAQRLIAARHGGKIINIASQAASIAIDNHYAYTSAKAGLLGMTKVMAKEWATHGITVNTLSPTVVLTPMGEKAWRGEKGEEMKKLIPLGRFAYTDEIAAAILFFASNGSDMMTGADLMIDGGFTIW